MKQERCALVFVVEGVLRVTSSANPTGCLFSLAFEVPVLIAVAFSPSREWHTSAKFQRKMLEHLPNTNTLLGIS